MLLPEVALCEPTDLDREAALSRPAVVICSSITPAVEETVPFWVEMYRNHGSMSTLKTRGGRREVAQFELSDLADLLALVGRSPGNSLDSLTVT